jgi:anti-sigma regulatory factor (Ser/Thr protein kinase)
VNGGNGPVALPAPGGQAPASAEHGRGLTIMDAVVDSLELTGNARQGTTIHFEKDLDWVPGAAGEHLSADDG